MKDRTRGYAATARARLGPPRQFPKESWPSHRDYTQCETILIKASGRPSLPPRVVPEYPSGFDAKSATNVFIENLVPDPALRASSEGFHRNFRTGIGKPGFRMRRPTELGRSRPAGCGRIRHGRPGGRCDPPRI